MTSPDDLARVTELLGRTPQGRFEVVARAPDGDPVVIRNEPVLDDGTPMPTRYWLVGDLERRVVGRLESMSGVRRAEAAVDPDELAEAHRVYAIERDGAFDAVVADRAEGSGPLRRPSGGVGGTATGVKCLHAHLANLYAGNHDPVGRWVLDQLDDIDGPSARREVRTVGDTEGAVSPPEDLPAGPTVAVVDIGTNTTRLLVRREGADLARRAVITRVGEGLEHSGRLGPLGLGRTLEAVAGYGEVIGDHGADRVRVLCTAAARSAANADELIDPVRELLGVDPEVLTGSEEGRLSFAGAMSAAPPHAGWSLVVDIGGGSTEFAVGRDDFVGAVSIPIGSVVLTERHVEHDPPRPEELSAMLSIIDAHLDDVARELPLVPAADRLIGVAGTFTTLAAVEIGLREWDRSRVHGFELSRDAAEDVFRTLATESLADRVHNPGLDPGRADVIVAGSAVAVAIMRRFGHDSCLVLDADLLDGAADEVAAR